MIKAIGAFKMQIPALISDLKEKQFKFFANTKDHSGSIWDPEKYIHEINWISDEFEDRSSDFREIEEIVEFASYPFKLDLNVSSVSQQISDEFALERGDLEMEMLAQKVDVFIKARASEPNS